MTDFARDLQGAIYSKLNTDPVLSDLLESGGGVYSEVPDDNAYPYVVLGDENIEAWNTKTNIGYRGAVNIHVWTQDQSTAGTGPVKAICDRIRRVLDDTDLKIPRVTQVAFRWVDQELQRMDDNKTYNGILEFNFIFGGE